MRDELDLEAARRQAIGGPFLAGRRDASVVSELKLRRMQLSPHPVWEFPVEIDWSADPFGDSNWRHQLPMLRWIDPLRRSAEDGDAHAAALWMEVASSWYRSNPVSTPASLNSWEDMVDGYRAIALSIATPMVAEYFPNELDWMHSSLQDHVRWLEDPAHLGHANHALVQHMGLFVAASVLKSSSHQALAADRLAELFAQNYDSQGINAEGAIAYHYLNYRRWTEATERLSLEDFAVPSSMGVLRHAPEALAHATKPDGQFVSIGDTDGGTPKFLKHPHTDYVSSQGAVGEPPPDLAKVYEGGYVFARSGWGEHERPFEDETFFSITFGSSGKVHGHRDGLSLTYTALGQEWLKDPGKFQYGGGGMRGYCLARETHNVPFVVGSRYRSPNHVQLLSHTLNGRLLDFVFRDEGHEGVSLRRRIIYSTAGEYLIVIDNVVGTGDSTVVQNWQLAPGIETVVRGDQVKLKSGSRRVTFHSKGRRPEISISSGEETPLSGWVSTGWKKRSEAPRLQYKKSGTRYRFITVIVPHVDGGESTVDVEKSATDVGLVLRIFNGRAVERVKIAAASVEVIDGDMTVPHNDATAAADRAPREEVLAAVAGARREAVSLDEAGRKALARRLATEMALARQSDFDLGVNACLSDLESVAVPSATVLGQRAGIVDWTGNTGHSFTRDELPSMLLERDGPGALPGNDALYVAQLGALAVPIAWSPDSGPVLTVLLHGAVERTKVQLPMFQRKRFHKSLHIGPAIFIADPTLDLRADLKLGWYLGTSDVDLHRELAVLIEQFRIAAGASKVLVVGSSGGGFAALQIAGHLPESVALAFSPQTDLDAYVARFRRAAYEAAFGVPSLTADDERRARTSALVHYEGLDLLPRAHVVSNSGDQSHVVGHLEPLRRLYASRDASRLTVADSFLGNGHRSPSNEDYEQAVRSLLTEL